MFEIIFAVVVQLISLILAYCLRRKSKLASRYLVYSSILSVFRPGVKYFYAKAPKPYTGISFILFSVYNLLYLLDPAILNSLSFQELKKVSISKAGLCFLVTIFLGFLLQYPVLRGAALITYFHVYYVVLTLMTLAVILRQSWKERAMPFERVYFIGYNLFNLCGLVIYYIYPDWLMVQVSNLIFYLAGFCFLWITKRGVSKSIE